MNIETNPTTRSICSGERIVNPVLQCVQIKPLNGAGVERFRVVFSDIRNFIQSMLATRLFIVHRS